MGGLPSLGGWDPKRSPQLKRSACLGGVVVLLFFVGVGEIFKYFFGGWCLKMVMLIYVNRLLIYSDGVYELDTGVCVNISLEDVHRHTIRKCSI